jgi:dolichol-phosphate mannosyltransferase
VPAANERKVLSVVVPVFGNEDSLRPLFGALREVEAGLKVKGVDLEIICVDDGSHDRSFEVLRALKEARPATRLVKLTRNFGAVSAARAGLRYVTGDCFLFLAADLQDPPELISEMAERWLGGSKYVLCVRHERTDSLFSKIVAALFYQLIRLTVVRDYPRGGYDLALMDRAFLPYLRDSAKNINTPLFAYWLGFKPDVLEYSRRKRMHGKSGWTFAKRFKFFLDSLLGYSIVPVRAMSLLGALTSLASFLYGSVIAIGALSGRRNTPGFATIVVITSFLLGVVIMMLGLIGEYLWRIYDEVSRKPDSVIDEID